MDRSFAAEDLARSGDASVLPALLEVPDHDKERNPRVDDQSVVDTGSGSPTYVDIGAYERQD